MGPTASTPNDRVPAEFHFDLANRISELAMRCASTSSLGRAIHQLLTEFIPAVNVYIAVYDASESLIRFPYWMDRFDPPPGIKTPNVGLTEYVLRKGVALFADAERLEELERLGDCRVLGTRPRYWVGIPLIRRGETFGVFAVQAYDGDPALEPRHADLLVHLAPTLSMAIFAQQIGYRRDRRDALLRAAADISLYFLRDIAWASHAKEALSLVGRAADVSRSYLFRVEKMADGRFLADQLFEWTAEGIHPEIDNPLLQRLDLAAAGFQRWIDYLVKGDPISGPVAQMPLTEQPLLRSQGILSLHIAPIHVDGEWWGFLGFDDCVMPRAWSIAERESLRLVATVFAQAILRERVYEQFELQRAALGAVANGVLITDPTGRILWVNDALCRLTGYTADEMVGRTPALFNSGRHPPEFFRKMWETIGRGMVWEGEITNRKKDGSLCTEEMTITPMRDATGKIRNYIAIKQDITERKIFQQHLAQIQKMESLGRLAGGIAHDFNNLLQAITGFSSMLLTNLSHDDPRREDVLEILQAAHLATDLTRQLLMFGRRSPTSWDRIQLNETIQSGLKMLRRLIRENISIETDLDPDLPLILGDSGQIAQILVNLCVNAGDAMPEGGRLRLSTRKTVFPMDAAAAGSVEEGQPAALLEVSDTGVGIAPEVMEKIFEPFFTTKEPGHGIGLGLSVVYGIVRQHHGHIEVKSRLHEGSVFRIYFPAAPADPQGQQEDGTAKRNESVEPAGGRGEHILVVEDEPGVGQFCLRILSSNRYRVTLARTAAEARACFYRSNSTFDLFFSDVVLPDGSGVDLAREFRQVRPALKVLLSSGYANQQETWMRQRERFDGFLPKPYHPFALLREIRAALDAAPQS